MNCFFKMGRKVIFKALTVTMIIGVAMVFAGGLAYAQEKSVTEKLLDIMLKSHQINQAQYDDLLRQAQAEKIAEAQKIIDAQRVADEQVAAAQAAEAKVAAEVATAPAARKPTDFEAYWKNGLRFTTDDKAFDIHIGGRTQVDIGDAEPDNLLTTSANKGLLGTNTPSKAAKTDGYGDQLRRVRLDIDGTIWSNIEFITQIEFAPSYSTTNVVTRSFTAAGAASTSTAFLSTGYGISFADVWLGVKDIPYVGRIRVGQMYEPISLEQQTSDNWNTFMEKSLPVNALVPNRNTGIEVLNTTCDDRIGWQVGYFFQQQVASSTNGVPLDATGDLFSPHLDATNVAARFTALPWYQNNGEQLVHVGIGYEHKFRDDTAFANNGTNGNPGLIDYKSSPEANLFSPLVDTGNFLAKGVDTIDPEFAFVCGPFSVQAEYMYAMANDIATNPNTFQATNNNAYFHGWYAYASYFITGEHRPYNKTPSPSDYQATFGRVIPNCNFNPRNGGYGAWEVAFRVSQLDVDGSNAGINGGFETDYTAGINWYLNPNVMVKLNFVHAEVQQNTGINSSSSSTSPNFETFFPTNGTDNIFETRFQIAF